jgi:hypothetical protein
MVLFIAKTIALVEIQDVIRRIKENRFKAASEQFL